MVADREKKCVQLNYRHMRKYILLSHMIKYSIECVSWSNISVITICDIVGGDKRMITMKALAIIQVDLL